MGKIKFKMKAYDNYWAIFMWISIVLGGSLLISGIVSENFVLITQGIIGLVLFLFFKLLNYIKAKKIYTDIKDTGINNEINILDKKKSIIETYAQSYDYYKILKEINKNSDSYDLLPDDLKSNEDFVMKLMNEYKGRIFPYFELSQNIRTNKEIMKSIIKKHPIYFLSDLYDLSSDKDFLKEVINLNGSFYPEVIKNTKYSKDESFMKFAIEKDYNNITQCSEKLINDVIFFNFCLNEIIKQQQYAPSRIIEDMLEKVTNPEILNSKSLFLNYGEFNYKFMSKELKDDKEFILSLLKIFNYKPPIIECISEKLKSDLDIGLFLAKSDYQSLNYMNVNVRDNPEIVSIVKKKKILNAVKSFFD